MRTIGTAWACPYQLVPSRGLHKLAVPIPGRVARSQLCHILRPSHRPAISSSGFSLRPLPATSLSLPSRTISSSPLAMSDASFYSLKASLPGGKTYDFEQLKGKVVLIVNTASKWCVFAVFCMSFNAHYPHCAHYCLVTAAASRPSTRVLRPCTRSTRTGTSSSSVSRAIKCVVLLYPHFRVLPLNLSPAILVLANSLRLP